MFLKPEVAEERQTVVRCGGVNQGPVGLVHSGRVRVSSFD